MADTIREMLFKIGDEQQNAKQEHFAAHPLAQYIRHNAPQTLQQYLNKTDTTQYLFKGSAGQAQWADVVWVSIFNRLVTMTATKGYYLVYLFHATDRKVYLSLNQGATSTFNEYKGKIAYEVLRNRSNIIRSRLLEYLSPSQSSQIDLGSLQQLPRGYEAGHAFGYEYDIDNLPSNALLIEHLENMINAYESLFFRGGIVLSSDKDEVQEERGKYMESVIETRQYEQHRRIERSNYAVQLAKQGKPAVCDVCGMSFSETYGELGKDFIEAHHLVPLSSLAENETREYHQEDFALLCSNCHRMIHRLKDPSNLDELRAIIAQQKAKASQ